jgi:hypothetical protein
LFENLTKKSEHPQPIIIVLCIDYSPGKREELSMGVDARSSEENALISCFEVSTIKSKKGTTMTNPHCTGAITDKHTLELVLRS